MIVKQGACTIETETVQPPGAVFPEVQFQLNLGTTMVRGLFTGAEAVAEAFIVLHKAGRVNRKMAGDFMVVFNLAFGKNQGYQLIGGNHDEFRM